MTAKPTLPDDAQKRALYEAAQAALSDAQDKQRERAAGRSTKASRSTVLVLGLMLFGVGIYLIAARPAWFFTPPPAPEPVEIRDASFRLTMVREAERVRQFQATAGRLPATLAEAGSPVQGVNYEALPDGTFTLRAVVAGETLLYRSTDSASVFLGDSYHRILSRVTP